MREIILTARGEKLTTLCSHATVAALLPARALAQHMIKTFGELFKRFVS